MTTTMTMTATMTATTLGYPGVVVSRVVVSAGLPPSSPRSSGRRCCFPPTTVVSSALSASSSCSPSSSASSRQRRASSGGVGARWWSCSPSAVGLRGMRQVCDAGGDQMPGPLDGLVDESPVKSAIAAKKARESGEEEEEEEEELLEVENVPPMQFLWSSVAFYVLMGVGSQVAASALDVHPDVFDAMRTCNLDAASIWTLPLLASLAFAITQADKFEFLAEVRDIFKVGVLPSLAPLGLPGIMALSLGAGVGEEAFFRGFLMPFADGQLLRMGAPEQIAEVGVLASTSVFFGALHAITPAYAVWATGAGLLFGLEYIRDGLGTAAFTHTLYDFLAFGFILVSWPIEGYEKEKE